MKSSARKYAICLLSLVVLMTACSSSKTTTNSAVSIRKLPVKPEEEIYRKTSAVNFIVNPDWKKVKALARKEKKGIYLYGYGRGCPGCEVMKKHIFPSREVADYIHANYIPVIADLFPASDNRNAWEKQVDIFKKDLRISSFPLHLLFDSEGMALTRFGNVGPDPQKMLRALHLSKEEKNQYYVQLKKFDSNTASEKEARTMIRFTRSVHDREMTDSLLRLYLRKEKTIFTSEKISFLSDLLGSAEDTAVQIILNNIDSIKPLENGYKAIRRALRLRISSKYPFIIQMQDDADNGKQVPDEFYIRQVNLHFPQYAAWSDELVMYARLNYIYKERQSPHFESYCLQYLEKHGRDIDYETVLQQVKELTDKAKNVETLTALEPWCDYLLNNYKNVNVIAAKAYVLSRTGRPEQARSFLANEKVKLTDPREIGFLERLKL